MQQQEPLDASSRDTRASSSALSRDQNSVAEASQCFELRPDVGGCPMLLGAQSRLPAIHKGLSAPEDETIATRKSSSALLKPRPRPLSSGFSAPRRDNQPPPKSSSML